MAGEKTEQPTEKKLRDARKKGQVAKSQDLTQAFLFLAASAALQMMGLQLVENFREVFAAAYRPEVLKGEFTIAELMSWPGAWFTKLGLTLAPLLVVLAIFAAAAGFLQVRALFSLDVLKPSLNKLNPLEGAKRFVKAKTWIEFGKNVLKFAVVVAICYFAIKGMMRDLALSGSLDPPALGMLAARSMFRLLYQAGFAFLVIGAADFMIQKKLFLKDQMMTKEEVKKEYKEQEGDPHVKGHRKQVAYELLADAEVNNVPQADVVLVNPIHLAVAVAYKEAVMNAPRVVAKGQNLKAEAIKEIARKSGIPVVENVPLARALFRVETGFEVPEEFYAPVAEVLLWVMELKKAEAKGRKRVQ